MRPETITITLDSDLQAEFVRLQGVRERVNHLRQDHHLPWANPSVQQQQERYQSLGGDERLRELREALGL